MTAMSKESVETLLEGVIDPHTGKGLVSSKSVNRVEINGDSLEIHIVLGYPAKSWEPELQKLIEAVAPEATVTVRSNMVSHEVQEGVKPLKNVKNIIAVASGKGGGRKIHHICQSCPRIVCRRGKGGHSGCGYLWPEPAQNAGCERAADFQGWQVSGTHEQLPFAGDVDWFPGR